RGRAWPPIPQPTAAPAARAAAPPLPSPPTAPARMLPPAPTVQTPSPHSKAARPKSAANHPEQDKTDCGASKGNPTDAVDRLLVELGQPFLHLLGKGSVKQPFDHDREPQRRQEIAHGAAAGAGVAVLPGVILPGAVMAGAVVAGVALPAAGAGRAPS